MNATTILDLLRDCPQVLRKGNRLKGYMHTTEKGNLFICADCHARLLAGGYVIRPAFPVWTDEGLDTGKCIHEQGEAE